jgi:predicted flavoprotein YhiN
MHLIAPKDSFDIMAYKLKNLKFHILDTREFKYAEVCKGGVDIDDIDPDTLQSKKVKNLYFCGEVLDIDGNCGGFNLQFAWSSGAVVAQNL